MRLSGGLAADSLTSWLYAVARRYLVDHRGSTSAHSDSLIEHGEMASSPSVGDLRAGERACPHRVLADSRKTRGAQSLADFDESALVLRRHLVTVDSIADL